MNIALTGMAVVGGLIMLAIVMVAVIGLRQPSRRIHRYRTVILAAILQDQPDAHLIA